MNAQESQSRSAAAAAELLSVPRFLEELRRVARYRRALPVGNSLDAVVRRIEKNPAFAQSRLLIRILSALTHQQGEFRRAEVAMLDAETLDMVIALMDVSAAGTTSREEWLCAVELAKAAQAGSGG